MPSPSDHKKYSQHILPKESSAQKNPQYVFSAGQSVFTHANSVFPNPMHTTHFNNQALAIYQLLPLQW